MKRLLVIALALLMVAPLAYSKKIRDKAGTLEGAVYQDGKFNFSLKVLDNWKVRVGDDDDQLRLTFTQKNYGIPSAFLNAKDYTKVPRIVLFVDTSSLPPIAFIDSLMSPTYKSAYKSSIMKEFDLVTEPELVTRSKAPMTIGGQPAGAWVGQTKLKQNIASSSGSENGISVDVRHGGAIVAIRNGNTMLVFHMMCEWEFFSGVQGEFMTIANSLTFATPKT